MKTNLILFVLLVGARIANTNGEEVPWMLAVCCDSQVRQMDENRTQAGEVRWTKSERDNQVLDCHAQPWKFGECGKFRRTRGGWYCVDKDCTKHEWDGGPNNEPRPD